MKAENSQQKKPKRKLENLRDYERSPDELVRVLAHPFRRKILRVLHEVGEARSPAEISKILYVSVGHASYHFKVLRDFGVVVLTDTRAARGAVEHFYFSVVSRNDLATPVLDLTQEDDEDDDARPNRHRLPITQPSNQS